MLALRTCALAATVVAALIAAESASAFSISDAEFADANWDNQFLAWSGGAGSTSSSQELAGGNGGAFRKVGFTVNTAPPNNMGWFGVNTSNSYDPSTSGAITSVDFSFDASLLLESIDSQMQVKFAVRQGGNLYVISRVSDILDPGEGWSAFTGSVASSDLNQQTGDVATHAPRGEDTSSHPDFTASGSTLEFGWYLPLMNTINGANLEMGVDNFSVELLLEVPEPGAAMLLLAVFGTLALGASRQVPA